jgi:hypothetical protein
MNANLKKYLPFIILGVGVFVLVGVFIMVKGKKAVAPVEDEEAGLMEVALADRPVVSLTPDAEGHYLTLSVEKLLKSASTGEYILEYQTQDGISQGTSGEIDMSQDTYENKLLLGTESSGKFRYDESVETGAVTLLFRNEKGKLLVKFKSDFHMQADTSELTSTDGSFTYKLDKTSKGTLFITMGSIGVPKETTGEPKSGPYVVRSSDGDAFAGTVSMDGANVYHFDGGDWAELTNGASTELGFFVGM